MKWSNSVGNSEKKEGWWAIIGVAYGLVIYKRDGSSVSLKSRVQFNPTAFCSKPKGSMVHTFTTGYTATTSPLHHMRS
jgi:hypothetical protein